MGIKITQQPTRFKVTAHDISERFGSQSLTMFNRRYSPTPFTVDSLCVLGPTYTGIYRK